MSITNQFRYTRSHTQDARLIPLAIAELLFCQCQILKWKFEIKFEKQNILLSWLVIFNVKLAVVSQAY